MNKLLQRSLIEDLKLKKTPSSVRKYVLRYVISCLIGTVLFYAWGVLTTMGIVPDVFGLLRPLKSPYYAPTCVCHPVNVNDKSKGIWSSYTYDEVTNRPTKIEFEGENCKEMGISGICNPLTDKILHVE